MAIVVMVHIENFSDLPDQVRQSALDKVEHAGPEVLEWNAVQHGVSVRLAEDADAEQIAERIRGLILETIASYRFFKSETWDEDDGAPINLTSPYPTLVATHQVAITSPGTPVYQGELARRLMAADDRIRELAWSRGAIEQLYPSTVPTASLTENGYLSSYPQHALLVAAIHRDVDSLARVATLAKDGRDFAVDVHDMTGEAEEVLAPTVCYRCFESLRRSPTFARPLSIGRTFTGIANCHRREDKALEELSRLQTFRMREIVFFGDAQFVSEHRQWWMSEFARILRSWQVRFRIVAASDAFFLQSAAQKRAYQSLRRLKYECQLHMPHADQWVAVASFNNHEATLTNAYGLTETPAGSDKPTHSGCVGFGFDRLVYGVLCQFGCDSRLWPEPLRQFFEEREGPAESGWAL